MRKKYISFMEHLVSIKMKKTVLKCQNVSLREFFGTFPFPSVNNITIDFNFTSIVLFQPESHAINKAYSYSGCPKSLHENNETNNKSVLPGSLA